EAALQQRNAARRGAAAVSSHPVLVHQTSAEAKGLSHIARVERELGTFRIADAGTAAAYPCLEEPAPTGKAEAVRVDGAVRTISGQPPCQGESVVLAVRNLQWQPALAK